MMQGNGPPAPSPLSSPALFAGHAAAAAAAAAHLSGQLQPPGASHHHHHHHQMAAHQHPVDLHVPSAAFPYYRYRDDALCWTDRKPVGDEMGHPTSVNARILELRKEKSRDAARSRRGKENYEFYELAKMLPLPAAITSQLDKASIIRLTISYLKLRDFSEHGHPPWPNPHHKSSKASRPRTAGGVAIDIFEQHQGTHILQSLDGFAFSLAADGRFLYVSETVSIYLGLSQVEMTGSSVFDYIHHQDHSELAEQLGLGLASAQPGGGGGAASGLASPGGSAGSGGDESGTQNPDVATLMTLNNASYKGLERAFCIRMKSTLTKRGCHFKSSGYRVVLVLCRLRGQYNLAHSRKGGSTGSNSGSPPTILGMVALAIALPPPSVHEIRLETDMFVTRINFDFRIVHSEPKVSDILDYTAEELTGRNLYSLCHGEDANKLRKCHVDLINKGQVMSAYYRLMNKNGGYTWLQTCATVVCNSKNNDEQNIICVNYVISGRELSHVVMDCCQLEEHRGVPVKRELGNNQDPENGSPDADHSKGRSRETSHRGVSNDGTSRPSTEDRGMNGPEGSRAEGGAGERTGQVQGNARSQISRTNGKRNRKRTRTLIGSGHSNGVSELSTSDDEEEESEEECSSEEEEEEELPGPPGGGAAKRGRPAGSTNKRGRGGGGRGRPAAAHQPVWNKIDQTAAQSGGTSAGFEGPAPVKQLEHAMTKLLPEEGASGTTGVTNPATANTDFSTDALLKQHSRAPSIHWIGNNPTGSGPGSSGTGPPGSGSSVLPATALLRQLYASRESVIRSNIQTPRGPQSSGFYADSTLATPPSDYDTAAAFNGGATYTPAGFATGTGGADFAHQSAITPPSSVSPRDGAGGSSLTAEAMAAAIRTQQYLSQAQSLPLKPQANMAHSVTPSMEHYMEARHQTQLYHHQLAAASFHIYHPAAAAAAAAASLAHNNSNSLIGPLSPNKSASPPLSAYGSKSSHYHSPWYSAPS